MSRKPLSRVGFVTRSCLICLTLLTREGHADSAPRLAPRDKALIEEAYNLWSTMADSIWPGTSAMEAPFLYVAEDYEYAIGFPATLKGFTSSGERIQNVRKVQVRKRTLARDLSASFPLERIPAVVMGTPEALRKGLSSWVITAGHEMFHVFQAANGSYEKTGALEIGPIDDSSWHLTFPFPYSDPDVMRLIHLQGYLTWLASQSTGDGEARYNIGTALEAARVYRSRLAQLRADEKAYRYSQYQEWNEGVAAYVEFMLAQKAAHGGYRPSEAYSSLPGFQSHQELWRQEYEARPFLAKHAGRAAKGRTAFYHLGLGKALGLDRVDSSWKQRYFAPGVWLDDLLAAAQ